MPYNIYLIKQRTYLIVQVKIQQGLIQQIIPTHLIIVLRVIRQIIKQITHQQILQTIVQAAHHRLRVILLIKRAILRIKLAILRTKQVILLIKQVQIIARFKTTRFLFQYISHMLIH
jgi:hypothetical protein